MPCSLVAAAEQADIWSELQICQARGLGPRMESREDVNLLRSTLREVFLSNMMPKGVQFDYT